jgi:hypothetical protein
MALVCYNGKNLTKTIDLPTPDGMEWVSIQWDESGGCYIMRADGTVIGIVAKDIHQLDRKAKKVWPDIRFGSSQVEPGVFLMAALVPSTE